jgi:hypothetical protein
MIGAFQRGHTTPGRENIPTLKENLLRLAFAPLVLLALVVALALSGHLSPG